MEPPRKLVQQSSLPEKRTPLCASPERSRRVQAKNSSAAPCGHSECRVVIALLMFLYLMIVSSRETLFAQTSTASPTPVPVPTAEPDGVTRGGYQIHSSVELGYRSNDVTGSEDMYDTLVNLRTGRLAACLPL